MGTAVVKECEDLDFVKSCMGPVWDDMREDNAPDLADWLPPKGDHWCEASIDGVRMGVFRAHRYNIATLQLHCYILPEYRKHRIDLTVSFYRYLLEQCTDPIKKFISVIASKHRNVVRYATEVGMVREGVITKSFAQNGVLYDLVITGITRDQMAGYVNG
jgi:hypothetical protein